MNGSCLLEYEKPPPSTVIDFLSPKHDQTCDSCDRNAEFNLKNGGSTLDLCVKCLYIDVNMIMCSVCLDPIARCLEGEAVTETATFLCRVCYMKTIAHSKEYHEYRKEQNQLSHERQQKKRKKK